MNSNQQLNSGSASFSPLLVPISGLSDENAQPGIPTADSSEAIPPAPDEEEQPHQQYEASGETRKADRGGEIVQPAMRIEIPAMPAESTETTDGYLRLRPWQERCLNALRDSHNWLINAPMAAGKTLEIVAIAVDRLTRNSDLKVIISVPQTPIAAGFRRYGLEMPDGSRFLWAVRPELDLCSASAKQNTKCLLGFLSGAPSRNLMGRVVLCTHSTLVRAFANSSTMFENVLIIIDEAHHVKHPGDEEMSSNLTNQLGALVKYGLARPQSVEFGFTTATFFRGDKSPIIPDVAQFSRFDLSHEEYFEGCRFLRSFSYDFILYGTSFEDPLKQLFDRKISKTIVYIPPVNSRTSLGAKGEDVSAVLRAIAGTEEPILADTDRPIMRVKRGERWIKVVDLVDAINREQKVEAIVQAHSALNSDSVDVVVALGMFKEGGNWRWADREIMIGHRSSLTEVIQMIGRLFRDVEGKSHVEAFQLLPFAFDQTNKEQTCQDLNQYLESVLLSMLLENVISPVLLPNRRGHKGLGERPINYLREAFADEGQAVAALEDMKNGILEAAGIVLECSQDLKSAFAAIVSKVLSARGITAYHDEIAEQVYRMFSRRTVALTRLNVGRVGAGLVKENPFGCLLQYASDACGAKTFRELRAASRPYAFLLFAEARAIVRNLRLGSVYEWYDYCASGGRREDIPTNPDHVYASSGWIGYRDWLGTETVWRDFREAREFVRGLQLKNGVDWSAYCKSGKKPDDIPCSAHEVYKDQGWCGLGDWLGTGTVAPRYIIFRPFIEAREFVRGLGLKSQKEWTHYCKSGKKPKDIPATAYTVYRDDGWVGLADWLGTYTIPSCGLMFRPFAEARQFVHTLGLRTQGEWFEYCKSGRKPRDIPASPNVAYKGKGWKTLRDWLGTEKRGKRTPVFRSFADARAFVQTLGLRGSAEWCEFSRSDRRPVDIPSNPGKIYKNSGWVNLGDWLGTGKIGKGRIWNPHPVDYRRRV
jgi:hypothetical protein